MSEGAIDLEYYENGIKELLKKREDAEDWAVSVVINEEKCENIPVGASKMGGLPDLPPGVNYPERERYIDEHDKYFKNFKLPLICQLNLADLAQFDIKDGLPKTGMLYIFWDGGDPDYFKKKYNVHPLRAYYWNGDISTLTRRSADPVTEVRPEMKATFSEYKETLEMETVEWEGMVEDLLCEFESDCKDNGIDSREHEMYDKIHDLYYIESEANIYGGDKISGFRAGCKYNCPGDWNSFLQLDEHEGALWYAYIHVSTTDVKVNGKEYRYLSDAPEQVWTELHTSVEYDAD